MTGEPGALSAQSRPGTGEAANHGPVTPPSNDATVIPTDATVIPTDATVIPTDATVVPTDATVVPTDAGAMPPVQTAAAAVPEAATTAPAPATTPDAEAIAAPARRRRLALAAAAGLTRLLRLALVLGLLVVGAAVGYQAFLTSRPAPTGPVVDPATAGNLPAPVVREFIAAVGRNDADAIRSAVPAAPYKSLTAEMARWEIQHVTSVETLATYEDGQRTATAFVMIGRDSSQNPVAINLIVETQAGNIVGFK